MKHKLQTLLKHKLQWLILLAALLGASQGVWCTVTDIRLTGDFTANGVSPSWSNITSLSFSNNATGAWYYNTFNVTKAGSAKAVQYGNWDWSYGSGTSNYSLSEDNYNIYANGDCSNGGCTLCVVATSKKYTGGSTLYLDCSNYTDYENDNATIKCYLYFDDNCNDTYHAATYNFAATGTSHIYSIEFPSYPVNSIKIERYVSGNYYNPISITTVNSGNCIQVTSSNAASMTTYSPPSCTTPSSGFAVSAILNDGDGSPWVGTSGSGTGVNKASGGQFSNGHREVKLSASVTADYYQWYTCNSSGSSLSAISGATAKTYTYDVSLPGTYYYICKAGCSNPADVASSVVQIDIPWPDMGISGPFYDGSWNHSSAGGVGPKFTNNNDGTWTNTFTPDSRNLTSEFVIIQQYKLDCTANSGWDGYQECSGSDDGNKICHNGSTISSHPGLNQTGACNFSSNISLNSGDVVTINVTMTDYDTYTVSMEKAACTTVCDNSIPTSFGTIMVGASSSSQDAVFDYGAGISFVSAAITGTDAGQFSMGDPVDDGSSTITVPVTYHPTSTGTHTATVTVTYSDGSNKTHTSSSFSGTAETCHVRGTIDGDNWGDNRSMTSSDGNIFTYTFTSLSAGQTYQFKIEQSGTWYTDASATITRASNSATISTTGGEGNNVTFVTDIAGDYTFTFNATSKVVTVTYPCPASYTTNYNVTGGGLYCDSDLPIGLSGSQNGYLYKLYKGSDAVDTQTGGGSALSFTSQYAAGTYTVKVTAAAGCPEESVDDGTTSSVTITSGTHPDKDYFSVSGNEPTYNGTAQSATVVSHNTGVYNPASITVKYGSASGTSSKTDAGEYGIYVTAASAVGNFCAVTSAIELDDKLTISKVTPSESNKDAIFDISGVPATVTYNGESHAATMNWKSGYSDVGTITIYYQKGSDAAINTAPVNAGTYAVTVSVDAGDNNDASASPISLGNIVINKAHQSTVTVTNAGNYCCGSSITAIAEGGNGEGAISFTKVSGPDGITINSSTGAITASTTGSIVVTAKRAEDDNYNESAASAQATFTIAAAPTAYTLTGDGGSSETKICSAGGTLHLSGSQTNYSYQLKKDGSSYGDAKSGTGSALEFTVNESGVFTCEAYLTGSPACKTTMNGSVTLHISLTPNLIPATPTVTSYTPLVITSINTDIMTWTISGAGNTAYLYNQTANTITVKAAKANSAYTITATTHGGCDATVTLTVVDDTETCNN